MRSLLVLLLALAMPAAAQDAPTPGGSIVITYKDDVATLDPAIGYDWQNWSMIKSLFDGLMDYEPGTTELRPGLAESYTISDDGLTYTFKLRDGVTFHNGRAMTAQDVVYSLNRVTNPATQSPGAGFFDSIAGYAEVAAGTAETLSGVKALDEKTVAGMQEMLRLNAAGLDEAKRKTLTKWIETRAIDQSMLAMLALREGNWRIVSMSFPKK